MKIKWQGYAKYICIDNWAWEKRGFNESCQSWYVGLVCGPLAAALSVIPSPEILDFLTEGFPTFSNGFDGPAFPPPGKQHWCETPDGYHQLSWLILFSLSVHMKCMHLTASI